MSVGKEYRSVIGPRHVIFGKAGPFVEGFSTHSQMASRMLFVDFGIDLWSYGPVPFII